MYDLIYWWRNRSFQKSGVSAVLIVAFMVAVGMASFGAEKVSAYSLTLTTSSSIETDVVPTPDNGIGATITADSVGIVSNCRAGYTLSITGPADNNLYLNGDDANNTAGTYFSPVDGTSALNSSANANKWGYSLTAGTRSGVFTPLTSNATTLKTPSQTTSPNSDINTSIPVYYGVSVDNSMAPGAYTFSNSSSITYTAVMDPSCLVYTVQYQDNGADNPNGMGTTDASTGVKSVKQINIAEDTKITLLAPNFKKEGYAFLGWSTDSQAYAHFTDNDNTNDPIIYGPMEDVVIDANIMATANDRNLINMYAVWIPALEDGNNNPIYMQEWDNPNTTLPHDGCSTLTATVFDDTVTDEKGKIVVNKNSVVALTDKRDNEVYTVARLADGNCWMTENLRLEAEYTRGANENDPTVTNQYLSQGYGGTTGVYGNFVGLADSESANFTNSTIANTIYKSDGQGNTYDESTSTLEDIGTSNYSGYRFPRYNNLNNSSALTSPTFTENYANASSPSSSGSYKSSTVSSYGNYYTWAAAMANTSWYRSPTGTYGSENASTSICPSSWHLPSSINTGKEYGTLSQSYGGTGGNQGAGTGDILSNRFRNFPNNFLFSGYINGSSNSSRGQQAHYWSRSTRDGTYYETYSLYLSSTQLWPSYYQTNKSYGSSVRCLIGSSDVQITLDSNNGTGAISRINGAAGNTVALPSSSNPSASIAEFGYGFKNWNTAPDGSGSTYTSSFIIPAGSTGETLYAQWDSQYTITYVNNCMSWASSDANCTQTKSDETSAQKINLDASGNGSDALGAYNKFTLTGWKIKEWTTNADGTGTAYPVSSSHAVTGASAGDGITLYAHWVPVYTVQYDGNGSDNDSTGMGSTDTSTGLKGVRHTNVAEGDTFDLFASNFKKSGYGFVGWSTDANAWSKLTDNDATNDAKIWGPNEIITAPAYNGTPITTLYAVWAPAETSGGNPVYLQGWTGCSAMTATTYDSTTSTLTVAKDSITALTDQRDNEVYTIAKLADGNCWMIENLRISTAGTVGNNVNDSSVTNQSLAQGYGGVFTGLADAESANFSNSTTANTLYSTTNITGSNQGYRFPRYNESNKTANVTPSQTQNITSANAHTNFNNTIYSYGNYYTWAAAIADTTDYTATNAHTNVATSLCPTGWHLPYGNTGSSGTNLGNTSGGFYYLANRMTATASNTVNSNKFRTFPNNFIYAGYWNGGSAFNRGNYGWYWSASAVNYGSAYNLALLSTYITPGNNYYSKYYGYSVRCVASPAS